jgi:AraC family transcriptional activator FtrA
MLLNERLLRAKDYLESSRLSIDSIAEQTGFGQASTLRHHFRQQCLNGCSPDNLLLSAGVH